MLEIAIELIGRHGRRTSAFGLDRESSRLQYLGATGHAPQYAVFAYDPDRDLAYHTPDPLSPDDLESETAVHFPEQLIAHMGQRPLASSVGHLAFIQPVISIASRISPLSALRALLERIADVNTALLLAEDGALTFVRRAGSKFEAHVAPHSLQTFLTLPEKSREEHFTDFEALEVLLLGADVLTSRDASPLKFDLERVRPIDARDVAEFISSESPVDSYDLIRNALAIATATLILDVTREASNG